MDRAYKTSVVQDAGFLISKATHQQSQNSRPTLLQNNLLVAVREP